MTAVMEYPMETASRPAGPAELDEVRAALAGQGRMLAAQHRMLELLDVRREQVDDLVADLLPVANAAVLMVMRAMERVGAQHVDQVVAGIAAEWNDVRHAPAPGSLALAKRLRDPDVRRGAAIMLAGLAALGRAADAPPPTSLNRRTT